MCVRSENSTWICLKIRGVLCEKYTADNLDRVRVITEKFLLLKKLSRGSENEVKLFSFFISVRENPRGEIQ